MVKKSLVAPLLFILYFVVAFIILFALDAAFFLIAHNSVASGSIFTSVGNNFVFLCRQVLPFSIIAALLILYVRIYRKPGSILMTYLLLFIFAGAIWTAGVAVLTDRNSGSDMQSGLPFSAGNIYRLEDKDIYVHRTEGTGLIRPVVATLRSGFSSDPFFTPYERLDYDSESHSLTATDGREIVNLNEKGTNLTPVVSMSGFFSFITERARVINDSIYRLYEESKPEFFLLTFSIIGFFVCGSIVLRISRTPLFVIVSVLLLVFFFFVLFRQSVQGSAAGLIRMFIPEERLFTPIIVLGYCTLLFLLFSINYSLKKKQME